MILFLLFGTDSTGGCNTLATAYAEGVLPMKQRPRIYYTDIPSDLCVTAFDPNELTLGLPMDDELSKVATSSAFLVFAFTKTLLT